MTPLPLLQVEGPPPSDLARWAVEERDALRTAVAEQGAILVRGLGVGDARQAEAVFRGLADLRDEVEAFAPRQSFAPGVYSPTKWPTNQPMCMHHELSYVLDPPGLLLFACLVPPSRGGATPVADASVVLEALPPDLVARFEKLGWVLVRNYQEDVGASLADAFGTEDRGAIERYCRTHAIDSEWCDGGGTLRTLQRRSAVVRHPHTGRRCWFNQIAFLNEWTLAPEVREYLVDEYGPDGLPFNTRFGNGEPIGPDIVQTINEVYEAHTVREPWQAGDLLLVDNVRAAHAKEPFEGARELVVGLAESVRVNG